MDGRFSLGGAGLFAYWVFKAKLTVSPGVHILPLAGKAVRHIPLSADPGGISGWMGSGAKSKARPSRGLRLHGFSTGLDYVSFDIFSALLHRGERVQTAAEAKSFRSVCKALFPLSLL